MIIFGTLGAIIVLSIVLTKSPVAAVLLPLGLAKWLHPNGRSDLAVVVSGVIYAVLIAALFYASRKTFVAVCMALALILVLSFQGCTKIMN